MTAVLVVSVGRITPAYAGKRRCGRRNGLCVQDHPRLCGEKKDRPPFSGCRLGSPPPMRGKVRNYNQRKGTSRITPAYAGKSLFCTCIQMCSEDHPRLCGEKSMVEAILCFLSGSPPPMRGKDQPAPRQPCLFRITPAYAGKSHVFVRYEMFYRDHPRLCGGKATIVIFFLPHFRITPAYAGKRWIFSQSLPYIQDHPRLCGEKRIAGSQLLTDTGSPPPMRGKVVVPTSAGTNRRITPAYAGKSSGNAGQGS